MSPHVMSSVPLHAEMKMYSLAVTPNGHLEGRGAMPPPIIMRTAATPMPTPKCSPHLDSLHALGDSRRGSNASLDPTGYDQKSLVGSCGQQLPLSDTEHWIVGSSRVDPPGSRGWLKQGLIPQVWCDQQWLSSA